MYKLFESFTQAFPQDDPKQRCPDISIAKDKLSWTPKINRNIGLKKTIRYFDSLLNS